MRYIAAYILAVMGGNEAPTADDIKDILSSVGIEADGERLQMVIKQLKGKNLEELMEEGSQRLSGPIGCGAGAASVAPAQGATGGGDAPAEEKMQVDDGDDGSSSEGDMGFGLFDD